MIRTHWSDLRMWWGFSKRESLMTRKRSQDGREIILTNLNHARTTMFN
jgi:hypothetical protein